MRNESNELTMEKVEGIAKGIVKASSEVCKQMQEVVRKFVANVMKDEEFVNGIKKDIASQKRYERRVENRRKLHEKRRKQGRK